MKVKEAKMTVPSSRAWSELQWSCTYRDTLVFRNEVCVGQLVFMYNNSNYKWIPYWVVDANDGKYDLVSAYGNDKVNGVPADKLGIAVNGKGETYNQTIWA